MRRTTQDPTRGGPNAPPDIVDPLTRQLLANRDLLPHAANGLPKAPSSPYAANVRREMGQGRSQEFKRLRAVAMCDLKDGVPFALVAAPFRQFLADLEMAAVVYHRVRVDRPLSALIRAEKKVEHRLELAELRVVESPTSVEAMAEVVREADLCRTALDALTTGCEAKLSLVRGVERDVYGARPMPSALPVTRHADMGCGRSA